MFRSIGGRIKKVKNSWSGNILSVFKNNYINEEFWDDLEEILISGDVSIELVDELLDILKDHVRKKGIKNSSVLLEDFSEILEEKLSAVKGMGEEPLLQGSPSVIILVGVNGSGKTTSAAKLAQRYKEEGKDVYFAAADTYRAAAIDQLQIWGKRAGIRVIAQKHGSDPAAVVFDAINAAKAAGADLVIVDTAGRLHSRHNLMEELSKIHRISIKEAGTDSVEVFLVLDAVMGQNGFRQAEAFNQILDLSGLILAKYDSTAKGGIILTIADKLKIPIRYLGLGEDVQDLTNFDPASFIKELLSTDQDSA